MNLSTMQDKIVKSYNYEFRTENPIIDRISRVFVKEGCIFVEEYNKVIVLSSLPFSTILSIEQVITGPKT